MRASSAGAVHVVVITDSSNPQRRTPCTKLPLWANLLHSIFAYASRAVTGHVFHCGRGAKAVTTSGADRAVLAAAARTRSALNKEDCQPLRRAHAEFVNRTRFHTTHYSASFTMLKLFAPSHLVASGAVARGGDSIFSIDEDVEVFDDLTHLARVPSVGPVSQVGARGAPHPPDLSLICPIDRRRCANPAYQALLPCLLDMRYCQGGFVRVRAASSARVVAALTEIAAELRALPGYVSTVADQDLINLLYRTYPSNVSLISCEWGCASGPVPATSARIFNISAVYNSPLRCEARCRAVHYTHGAWRTLSGGSLGANRSLITAAC